MSRTVIFLGAGSSKGLGLPLTTDIFPMLLGRLNGKASSHETLFGGDATDQQCLKLCLGAILPGLFGFSGSLQNRQALHKTLPPITDVLSAIDYFLLSAKSLSTAVTLTELGRARMLLERAMFELLVRSESPDALRMQGVPDAVSDEWRQTAELEFLPQRPPITSSNAAVWWTGSWRWRQNPETGYR